MQVLQLTLAPRSAFGTRPLGDTLFGQLCWAVRHRLGEARLVELLEGYTAGRPFAVVSDALPAGHLPRPALPVRAFALLGSDRKQMKKRVWLPVEHVHERVADWLVHCRAAGDLPGGAPASHPQPHNSLHRETNTTGNGFDPYSMEQWWYGRDARLDIWVVLDDSRLPAEELRAAFEDIGATGFGRDASIGLGKFVIERFNAATLPAQPDADAWLTLAPCAPQGMPWDAARCYYHPFTRFGRHGDIAVHSGKPFKSPVLLADAGAVLTPRFGEEGLAARAGFTGQGLGGDGSLSKALPGTVHQGYAPVVGIKLPVMDNTP
jgi:CRISPR-associated protein Csm4